MSERESGSVSGMVHLGGEAPSPRQWVLWAGSGRGRARQQCMLGPRMPCLPAVPNAKGPGGKGGEHYAPVQQNHSNTAEAISVWSFPYENSKGKST